MINLISRRQAPKLGGWCLTALAAAVLSANAANAQQQGNAKTSLVLEEIIISAQKREQNTLDVPITVDNFSAQDIENTGALGVRDIDVYIPGFESADGVTQSALTIRGVSSSNISVGGDPSVATFYDGVYLPQAASTVTFSDLARVEVLKGPQGTLYGRNASVGVVNIVPNQPNVDETEGFVQARVGTDNLVRVEGMVNAPIGDDFAVRANVLSNQKDGYVDNLSGGADSGEQDNQAARISLLWNVSDDTDVQLSYDWDQVDNSPKQAMGISDYSYSRDPMDDKVENDVVDGEETRDMDGITAKVSHRFNDQWSMKFTSSYRQWETTNREEEDGTGDITVYADTNNEEDSDIFYNEVSFHFQNETFDWVFGANYSEEDVKQRTTVSLMGDSVARLATAGVNEGIADFGITAPQMDHMWNSDEMAATWNAVFGTTLTAADIEAGGDDYYNQMATIFGDPTIFGPSYAGTPWPEYVENTGDFKNYGIYTDVDISLTDSWNLILGARYSKDEKDFTWYSPTTNFPRDGVSSILFGESAFAYFGANDELIKSSDDWSETTGRGVLKYQINDTASTFASVSTGYKSGGFDSLDARTATTPFAPETSVNYEWGIKGDFIDGRLRTQLSVYRLEIDDLQRSISSAVDAGSPAIPLIISGDQTNDGVELTLDWLALESLKLGLVTTYRDADQDFGTYNDASGNRVEGKETSSTDLAYTLAADWTPSISVGELLIHVDYVFEEQSLDDDPNYQSWHDSVENFNDDKKFLNARIAWFSDDGHYEAALWGKNLLDNQYTGVPGGLTAPLFDSPYTSVNEPLSWGADLRYNF